jgi:hypothetical protein
MTGEGGANCSSLHLSLGDVDTDVEHALGRRDEATHDAASKRVDNDDRAGADLLRPRAVPALTPRSCAHVSTIRRTGKWHIPVEQPLRQYGVRVRVRVRGKVMGEYQSSNCSISTGSKMLVPWPPVHARVRPQQQLNTTCEPWWFDPLCPW